MYQKEEGDNILYIHTFIPDCIFCMKLQSLSSRHPSAADEPGITKMHPVQWVTGKYGSLVVCT